MSLGDNACGNLHTMVCNQWHTTNGAIRGASFLRGTHNRGLRETAVPPRLYCITNIPEIPLCTDYGVVVHCGLVYIHTSE